MSQMEGTCHLPLEEQVNASVLSQGLPKSSVRPQQMLLSPVLALNGVAIDTCDSEYIL